MPTGEKVFSGGLYIAEKVGKDDGGVYQCSADNGYGGDAIQQVKVDIVCKSSSLPYNHTSVREIHTSMSNCAFGAEEERFTKNFVNI